MKKWIVGAVLALAAVAVQAFCYPPVCDLFGLFCC